MTTLFPRGYGGHPSYQFNSPNQITKQSYYGRYATSGTSFASPYSAQTMYQPPVDTIAKFPFVSRREFTESSIGERFLMLMHQLDEQYRQEQYARWLEKMRRQNLQQQLTTVPPPFYSPPPPLNYPQTEMFNDPYYDTPLSSTVNFGPGGMGLPPKVRVIFIPPGQSSCQQPWTGPLSTPPFFYNRVSQPSCSFPLPPPLPQIGSMPVAPAIQQMIMERYSNPVAVLPFNSNWQMPQSMMSGYPQAPQQQPMMYGYPQAPQQQPMMYGHPQAPQQQPMMYGHPQAPQQQPMMYGYPQVPQQQPMVPMAAFPTLPPAPQSYIPAPPSIPPPFSDPNAVSSTPQYSNGGYPSMCRACPPAPPPLNMPVTGYCWVQHCSACHHVPNAASNPNVRPANERSTPLLRHPTVPQYVPDQTAQQQVFHANAPVMMRPWLRKTPPLPPGAVLISDEYIDKKDAHLPFNYSEQQKKQNQHSSHSKRRSRTETSRTRSSKASSMNNANARSVSPRKTNNNNNNNSIPFRGLVKSESTSSAISSSSLSSGLSAEYHKTTLYSSKTKQKANPSQLDDSIRNINLQRDHPAQELTTVDHINRYLKSSSEASTLSVNLETLSDRSPSIVNERSRVSSNASDLNSIKEEPNLETEDEPPPRPPSLPKKPKGKLIVIREFIANSPSTISSISSDLEFSVIDKDIDCISITSTIKANQFDEDIVPAGTII